MNGDRGADNASSKDDDIGPRHGCSCTAPDRARDCRARKPGMAVAEHASQVGSPGLRTHIFGFCRPDQGRGGIIAAGSYTVAMLCGGVAVCSWACICSNLFMRSL